MYKYLSTFTIEILLTLIEIGVHKYQGLLNYSWLKNIVTCCNARVLLRSQEI